MRQKSTQAQSSNHIVPLDLVHFSPVCNVWTFVLGTLLWMLVKVCDIMASCATDRAMVQDSVECAGPQKHNGEYPVFIHWMVLEIQPLFWMSSTECDSSTKHDALLYGIRKNSHISRTIQCINTGLSPLCFWGPAHSTESCTIALDSGWRCPPWKYGEIHCPIKDVKTWLTFNDTSQCPKQLRQPESGAQQQGHDASRSFQKHAESCLRHASEKQHGTESENTYNFPIIDTFRRYFWKAISPEASNSGTPKLGLQVRRVCTIDGSPHPLPVIYMYGTGASNYTCRQNIHHLLYLQGVDHQHRKLLNMLVQVWPKLDCGIEASLQEEELALLCLASTTTEAHRCTIQSRNPN